MNIQEQSWPSFLSRVFSPTGPLIFKLFRILIIFQLIIGLSASGKPYVLLISFDGFRADYLEWYFTPNFDRLASKGVKAQGLKPVFVTKTFPNHYSIVTGMYIETHGLIGNDFYARDLGLHFRLSDRSMVENARFYGGEPIWVTAENQGLKTAAFFWVGSEAPIGGIFPSIWKPYDESIPFRARIDSIAAWFELPSDRRPNLALLYFNEPDGAGHNYGPKAPETEAMIEQLDEIMGLIIDKMELLSISDSLNIIVVADHGMAEVDPANVIKLYRYFNFSGLKIEGTNPYVFLSGVSPRRLNKIYKTLSRVPHLKVYLKPDIPEEWYFKNNARIKDLLVLADEGWSLAWKPEHTKRTSRGNHGYDNNLRSMQAIFLAQGPAFKKQYTRPVFENIHIYPLLAYILDLKPNPDIDGNLDRVRDILK